MAADDPQAAPGGAPPRKKKPVPTWYYVAGAGALVVAYYAYSKSQANKAAAAAAAQPAPIAAGVGSSAGTAAGSYGNAGDLASLLPYLQGNQSTTAATTGSGAAYTAPTGEVIQGSGYWQPQSTTPITGNDNSQYQWISALPQLAAVYQSGQPTYIQIQPGVFMPAPPGGTGLAAGTPQYLRIGAAPSQ
jgi:hypothetical protein